VVVAVESGVLLGVQIAGPGAADLIGAGALAVETACRAEDLARTVLPHPTLVESLGDAARVAMRRLARRPDHQPDRRPAGPGRPVTPG
jgi:dihydrolipoamide dehydrogenase